MVEAPTGLAYFEYDVVNMPRRWSERYHNLKHYSAFRKGGHFAPMEEPETLVNDLREFLRGFSMSGTFSECSFGCVLRAPFRPVTAAHLSLVLFGTELMRRRKRLQLTSRLPSSSVGYAAAAVLLCVRSLLILHIGCDYAN